ncbi:uncharacterized protein LOC34623401 [Cyclospora cayetanensis]|uniref:Uncharacterized protein LOC34623401 n=1 Tax=Cyclospora cayetanensis TaxID=88456 RepID=A0A6P6RPR7_9EIME|nr:uncharacterized protein LOC34623401 [Cyclospora cayetanensis]
MFGVSFDTPQRVRPARLRPSKQQHQPKQTHSKRHQQGLFIQARNEIAGALSPEHSALSRSDSAASAAAAAAAKGGRLVAVTTYSGCLDDYLLLHSTDGSSSGGSNSCVASPLRGSSEEEISASGNLLSPPQELPQQGVEEFATDKVSSRQVSHTPPVLQEKQQQQPHEDEAAARQQSTASQSPDLHQKSEERQQTSQQRDGGEGRLIVPPAIANPDGSERHQWPQFMISLLPHIGELQDIQRIAAFAHSAAEIKRLAEAPLEAVSPAAAALQLQQQLQQQQRRKHPLHWTLKEGIRTLCNSLKPQQTTLPPIKLPVLFPDQGGCVTPVSAGENRGSMNCSNRECSTPQQPNRSSSTASKATTEGPFEEEVSVQLQGGGHGRVIAITKSNNLLIRLQSGANVEAHPSECRFIVGGTAVNLPHQQLPQQQPQQEQQRDEGQLKLPSTMRGADPVPTVSELLQRAAAESARTHNTVVLPSLASVARVSKTSQTVEVFKVKTKTSEGNAAQTEAFQAVFPEEAGSRMPTYPTEEEELDIPECALVSPGICPPKAARALPGSAQGRFIGARPQANTYDVIRAPGIVRPVYDVVKPTPEKQPFSPFQQQSMQYQPQPPQQNPLPPLRPQLAELATLAGPSGGPAAVAAAQLGVVGEKWFEDLQQQLTREMMQRYVNTAPEGIREIPIAPQSAFSAVNFSAPSGERRTAKVLREDAANVEYALPSGCDL